MEHRPCIGGSRRSLISGSQSSKNSRSRRKTFTLHSPQSRDLQFELLDLQRLRHETGLGGCELRFACLSLGSLRGDDLVQRGGVGGEICEIESHAECVAAMADSSTR